MSVFTWVPDQGVGEDFKARTNKAQFGDGYSQRSADGLNSITTTLNLSFTHRTRTEIDAIKTFLKAALGTTNFDYTVPGEATNKYICEEWSATYNHDADCSLTCKFEQVFEV